MGNESSLFENIQSIWPDSRQKRSAHSPGETILRRSKRAHDIDLECNEEIFCWARFGTVGWAQEVPTLGCNDTRVVLKQALVEVQTDFKVISEANLAVLELVKEKHCRQAVRDKVSSIFQLVEFGENTRGEDLESAIEQALAEAEEVQSCQIKEAVYEAVGQSWPLENHADISAWLRSKKDGLNFYVNFCSGGEASLRYIMGGSEAQEGDWSSAVAIYKDNQFICGGTIIERDIIVTAAHCLAPYTEAEGGFYTVRAGMLRKQSSSPWEQHRIIKEVIIRHDYDNIFLSHDVALAKLNESLAINKAVQKTCLPHNKMEDPPVGTTCKAVGWGDLGDEGLEAQQLMTGTVPIRATCTRSYNNLEYQICGGYEEGGKDSCQGDSGGPLYCKRYLDEENCSRLSTSFSSEPLESRFLVS